MDSIYSNIRCQIAIVVRRTRKFHAEADNTYDLVFLTVAASVCDAVHVIRYILGRLCSFRIGAARDHHYGCGCDSVGCHLMRLFIQLQHQRSPKDCRRVLTCLFAARVGGPSWLKALIGRARETFAVVEMETMSSTSHEVCECWNGRSIVRVRNSGLDTIVKPRC